MVQVQAIAQNTETLRLLARKRRKLMRKLEERETLSGHWWQWWYGDGNGDGNGLIVYLSLLILSGKLGWMGWMMVWYGMPFHDFVMDIHVYSPCHCSLRQHLEQNLGILSHVYLRQADVDLQQLGSTRGNAATGVSFGQRTKKLAPHAPLKACTFKLWLGERWESA